MCVVCFAAGSPPFSCDVIPCLRSFIMYGGPATAFFEPLSLLKTTRRRKSHQDIIHSPIAWGDAVFFISSPWLLSWWELTTQCTDSVISVSLVNFYFL